MDIFKKIKMYISKEILFFVLVIIAAIFTASVELHKKIFVLYKHICDIFFT
jgi:hypothetical protein